VSRAIGTCRAKVRFYKSVGSEIRRRRMDAGMSQRELSAAIDGSESAVMNIESGRTMPSFWVANQIAFALDCSLDDLAPVLLDERESA
jgi:ribosome-binding protein aMBF1 (putative translation factor)